MVSYEVTIGCDGKNCTSTVTSNVFVESVGALMNAKIRAGKRDWFLISGANSANGKGAHYCPECVEKVTKQLTI